LPPPCPAPYCGPACNSSSDPPGCIDCRPLIDPFCP
jgi:hypothetical protein